MEVKKQEKGKSDAGQYDEVVLAAIASQKQSVGALLSILHHIQDRLGYIPPEALPLLAKELNLSRAEIHGVVTFYPHFRSSPPGKHLIQICRAEACQAMGAERLFSHAQASLRVKIHETTQDGNFTLEPVYCLGNCACSPAMMIDDELYGRVIPDRFDAILRSLKVSL